MTTRKDHLVQLVAAERLARLFCTAPELLEALTMVRDADADCVRDGLPRWCTEVARAKIDAAIAKAEGVE